MKRVAPAALSALAGLWLGWMVFAPDARPEPPPGEVVGQFEVVQPPYEGKTRLVTYRAARADGGGEIGQWRDKPNGTPEWIITFDGVQHRCFPINSR